jgi:succinate dehydrogenase/fumarate reductase flavoprotein subunit
MVRSTPGSEVLLEAEPIRLLDDGDGVRGAEIRLASGEARTIEAAATLLATGGFANSPALRVKHIGEAAAAMPLRGNPQSAGVGLELGLAAGGTFGQAGAGFYGHLMAALVPVSDPSRFAPMTFYHSEHGVLLNLWGERFVDETLGDQLSTLATLEQPEGRALLVYDERVRREWMMKPYVKGVEPFDKFAAAYKAGGRCAVAQDLEEFAEMPAEWGYPGPAVHDALRRFNADAEAARHAPPRTRDPLALDEPPYYVVEVVPAITFTFGGLLIDAQARVLDADGIPIPGLLAAGADAGGLYHRAYAGGLAPALVFGRRAADTALARGPVQVNEGMASRSPLHGPRSTGDRRCIQTEV